MTHSEFNPSKEPLRLLQIWMVPEKRGLKPAYDQKNFSVAEKKARRRLVASPDGADGSVKIRQDNSLYATVLDKDETVRPISAGASRCAGGEGAGEAMARHCRRGMARRFEGEERGVNGSGEC